LYILLYFVRLACAETFNPSPLPLHKGRALKPPPYVRGIEGVRHGKVKGTELEKHMVLDANLPDEITAKSDQSI
jgi:hypothetical protein